MLASVQCALPVLILVLREQALFDFSVPPGSHWSVSFLSGDKAAQFLLFLLVDFSARICLQLVIHPRVLCALLNLVVY